MITRNFTMNFFYRKNVICMVVFVLFLLFFTDSVRAGGDGVTAIPSQDLLVVEGAAVYVEVYNIDNYNYYKLRDLAFALRDTEMRFEVLWDGGEGTVEIISGSPYTAVGGELETPSEVRKPAYENRFTIKIDGIETEIKAYLIDGNNYLKLRDLGEGIGFAVTYNPQHMTISLENGNLAAAHEQEEIDFDAYVEEVLTLVNNERLSAGVQKLSISEELNEMANIKALDMIELEYFDHESPNYGWPADLAKTLGISYRSIGENIAKGQITAEEVVDDWMNSPGHKANILNASFTEIGIACVAGKDDRLVWVQIFRKN